MSKVIYPTTRMFRCPRCRHIVRHILYNYEFGIYKCPICGNLHA